ncbi:MAG: VOC family protein [Bacteroidia bacterium]
MKDQQITPCLWFDSNGKEAAEFYCAIFSNARITTDTPMVVMFEVAGEQVMCLNGGSKFRPNPSISLFYISESKEEIQKIWEALSKGGNVLMPLDAYPWSDQYGWLQDKYGVSWQLSSGKLEDVGQHITPCLLFTGEQLGRAEEALNHYTYIFNNSKVDGIMRYDANSAPDKEGTVMHAQFGLNGYKLMVMDSAQDHRYEFDEGVSLMIECKNQEEIDHYWNRLTEGGAESMCGWLEDKFGVSWQVVPENLGELMGSGDPEKSERVMNEILKMKKIDVATLERA